MIQKMPLMLLMVIKTVPPKTQNFLKVSIKKPDYYNLTTKMEQILHVLADTMK